MRLKLAAAILAPVMAFAAWVGGGGAQAMVTTCQFEQNDAFCNKIPNSAWFNLDGAFALSNLAPKNGQYALVNGGGAIGLNLGAPMQFAGLSAYGDLVIEGFSNGATTGVQFINSNSGLGAFALDAGFLDVDQVIFSPACFDICQGGDFSIDDLIFYDEVPAPATLAFIALGALAGFAARRKI